jgi:hypothetical protein
MTRVKKAPAIRKPPFDEESVLRFAEKGLPQKTTAGRGKTDFVQPPAKMREEKKVKESDPERRPLNLMLKLATIAHLQQEAFRKGKSVNQIVDKLVAKHLGKF